MTDEIIKLREQLVELSKDPIETRKLLDQLTEEEIEQANIESPFHVGKKDIVETKDIEVGKIHKTKNGYCLHYHGGYSILVDDKMIATASTLQQIMDGVPEDVTDKDEKEGVEIMLSAAEQIFRIPMYIFSHPITMLNMATMGLMYQNYIQKMGEVPTEETDNPEYDKFILQMNDLMENCISGLEKAGKEYEKRMGYGEKVKNEGESESESEAEPKGEE